jgi:hydroxylamine reductase (hybrid-cluster protein)
MNTKDLIQSIVSGDKSESSSILNTLLKDKVKNEVDLQRVTVANNIFNDDAEEVVEQCGKKKKSKEVEEGNEFTKAAAKAVLDGEEEFEFNGKTYKATIDKEAAKKILGVKEETLEESKLDLKSLHGKPGSVWHKLKISDYDKKRDDVLAFFHKSTNSNKKEVFIDGNNIVIMRRGKPNMMPAFSKSSGITFKDVYDDIIKLLDSVQH